MKKAEEAEKLLEEKIKGEKQVILQHLTTFTPTTWRVCGVRTAWRIVKRSQQCRVQHQPAVLCRNAMQTLDRSGLCDWAIGHVALVPDHLLPH